jgi:hypothetical protein
VLLQDRFAGGVTRIDVPDPDEAWAVSALRDTEEDTGHSMPL